VSDLPQIEQPWTVHGLEEVSTDRHRVEIQDVETPWGQRFVKPKIISLNDYASVVPFTPEGKVVMVRQYRHGIEQVCPEFPAGGIEPGEDPLAAAKRELAEETFLSSDTWVPLGRFAAWPDLATQRGWFYAAFDCVDCEFEQHEPTEPFAVWPDEAHRLLLETGGSGNLLALLLALDARP
jgi:8-oxo-dGTP pyrophosphatase MutT (NUDIX family)